MTWSRKDLLGLMDAHGLSPSRSLGQNFVVDANTVRKIVHLADVGIGSSVVEIGAGLGSLTVALAESQAKVVAVEIDRRLLPVLREAVEPLGVTVVAGDALELDWEVLLEGDVVGSGPSVGGGGPPSRQSGMSEDWVLVANLPYNVAVPVVMKALDEAWMVQRLLVMVQREVGERLVATPGSKAYGAVSVKVAYHSRARLVGKVPAAVFVPKPKVESVLVRMDRLPEPAVDPTLVDRNELFSLIETGFGQRRKMLRNALAELVSPHTYEIAGVDPTARAESLDVGAWGRLAVAAKGQGSLRENA